MPATSQNCQLIEPFKPFNVKASAASAYAILPDGPSGWSLFLTATQSILSNSFIALFLLAIRWPVPEG
jgi:hypothetical protein